MRRTTALALAALLLAACFGGTACSNRVATQEAPPLTVGYRDIGTAAPLLLAAAEDASGEKDYRLVAKPYRTDGELFAAVKSGDVTMAVVSVVEAAKLRLDRVPVIIVGATAESFGRDGIVGTQALDSVDDLVGQTVVTSGNNGSFFVWSMVAGAGLDPEMVMLENRPYGELEAALGNSEAVAAAMSGPILQDAAESDNLNVLLTTEDFPGVLTDVVVVRKDYAEANQEKVQSVLGSLASVAERLNGGEVAARQAVAREASVTTAKVAAASTGLRYLTAEDVIDVMGVVGSPGPLAEVAQDALDFHASRQGAQTPPDTEGLVDSRYVNPAAE